MNKKCRIALGCMSSAYGVAAICLTLLSGEANAQGNAGGVTNFASMAEASEAFAKSTDTSFKSDVYEWMKSSSGRAAPHSLGDLLSRSAAMARQLGKDGDFLEFCSGFVSNNNPEVAYAGINALSDFHASSGNNELAVEVLRDGLGADSKFDSPRQSSLASKAASLLAGSSMRKHQEALAVLSDTMRRIGTNDVVSYASLANQNAGILLNNLSDGEGAGELSREVISYGGSIPGPTYATAANLLYSVLRDRGDSEGAAGVVLSALEFPSVPCSGFVQKLLDLGAPRETLEKALSLLRGQVVSTGLPGGSRNLQSKIENIQPEAILLLSSLGRYEEAMGECRVYMFCSSTPSYQSAVDLTARTLKALDGNLGRANAFLQYQGADPETTAGRRIVLMEGFPMLDDEVRRSAAKQLEVPPKSWNDWLSRSMLLLWLDRPAESMDSAMRAFAASPLSSGDLQQCADAVVRPYLIATRDARTAKAAVDYMLFGEMGPDGATGTSDDLDNPFPQMRRELSYTSSEPGSVPVPVGVAAGDGSVVVPETLPGTPVGPQ